MRSFVVRTANLESGDRYFMDELHIGTTWESVVIPEPGSAMLVLAGLGLLALLTRQRR